MALTSTAKTNNHFRNVTKDARHVAERRGHDDRLAGSGLDENVRGDH
jgi:hypothetical protein